MKKSVILFCIFSFTGIMAHSQAGPPIAGTGPGACFPPPCIPIDGGLSLLIAAGIGIAGKKAYDFSKQEQ